MSEQRNRASARFPDKRTGMTLALALRSILSTPEFTHPIPDRPRRFLRDTDFTHIPDLGLFAVGAGGFDTLFQWF